MKDNYIWLSMLMTDCTLFTGCKLIHNEGGTRLISGIIINTTCLSNDLFNKTTQHTFTAYYKDKTKKWKILMILSGGLFAVYFLEVDAS